MFTGSRLSNPQLLGYKYTTNPVSNQIAIHLGTKVLTRVLQPA